MPTVSVIAVFVSKQEWIKFQLPDQSLTDADWIQTDTLLNLAHNLNESAWLALQQALRNPDQWVPVGKVVTI